MQEFFWTSKILHKYKMHVSCTMDLVNRLINYLKIIVFYVAPERDGKILEGRDCHISFVSSFTPDINLSMQKVLNIFRYSVIHWWMKKMWKAVQFEGYTENNESERRERDLKVKPLLDIYAYICVYISVSISICIYM